MYTFRKCVISKSKYISLLLSSLIFTYMVLAKNIKITLLNSTEFYNSVVPCFQITYCQKIQISDFKYCQVMKD